MAEIYRPIDSDIGSFSPSVQIRQWTVVNMSVAPVYINLSSDPPTPTNKDYVIPRQQTFTGPPCNTQAISWRTALSPTSQRPVLIVYTEVQGGIVQTIHEASLGDQCPGYPDVHYPPLGSQTWHPLPPIQPNVHTPVVFYVSTRLFRGSVACILALEFPSAPQRQWLYACGRVGAFTYTFPDAQVINPSILINSDAGNFEPGDPPNTPVTVDAYYTSDEQCHVATNYQHDMHEPPLSLTATSSALAIFGVMPGYWRLQILVGSALASTLTIGGRLIYGYADGTPDRADTHTWLPDTALASPNTGGAGAIQPVFDTVIPISKPAELRAFLQNSGASTIGAIHVHLHKL